MTRPRQWKSAPDQRAAEVLNRIKDIEDPYVVEVGVNLCAMARIILKERPNINYTMVDLWTHEAITPKHYKDTNDRNALRKKSDALKARSVAMGIRDQYPNVTLLEGDSKLVGKSLEPKSAHLVFIDADHSYEGVKGDIQAYKNVPTVWIGGHDYKNNDPKFDFSGVEKAVHEFYDEVEAGMNFTWWYYLGDN